MSLRYKGARLSATPPTTVGGTTAGANAAPGIWTLDQQMKAQGQSAWPGAGNWIEDVFSTYLYAGNSSTQTITNDINLSGQGGLVWIKDRTNIADHRLIDTVTGAQKELISNQTTAQVARTTGLTAFNNNGFSLGSASGYNTTATNYVSWAFREQSKFFDVVTYTGNGVARTIPHNLGSVPGCIIVKVTSAAGNWWVYHRSLTNAQYLVLNTSAGVASGSLWNSTTPTATEFSIGATSDINNSGATYVAYLFAHDAGGFGATGTDNVISCGSFTTNSLGNMSAPVNLGYEPQWLLMRLITSDNWMIVDAMRGWNITGSNNTRQVYPNLSNAEAANSSIIPTATGFTTVSAALSPSNTYIYVAIRRGPMKTPTSGTSVFSPLTSSAATGTILTTGFPIDMQMNTLRGGAVTGSTVDRLRGVSSIAATSLPRLFTYDTAAETNAATTDSFSNTGFTIPAAWGSASTAYWNFRRAPGFFDVVCYSGDSTLGRAIQHNLAAIPELMIVKNRNNTENWVAYSSTLGNTKYLIFNSTAASGTRAIWANTTPTSTNFYVGGSGVLGETNFSSYTYVAYLFATVAGVSKVGSYTGTGALQTVNCGFTSGARFVLIKRTDTTGDWWAYDSARGISSGNDPYFFLNSTAAEVTGTNYVDTASTGFQVTAAAPAGLNANGGTYIFLAIA